MQQSAQPASITLAKLAKPLLRTYWPGVQLALAGLAMAVRAKPATCLGLNRIR